jgi:hypothetical protein
MFLSIFCAELYALSTESICKRIGNEWFRAKNHFFVFVQKIIFFFTYKIKKPRIPLDAEKKLEHFWSAYLVMNIKCKKPLGDQRILLSDCAGINFSGFPPIPSKWAIIAFVIAQRRF